jgi:hypothetical protein
MARSGRKVGIADTPEVLMVGVGGSGVKESKVGCLGSDCFSG